MPEKHERYNFFLMKIQTEKLLNLFYLIVSFWSEDVNVFTTDGDFKGHFDKLLHTYGINRNAYWSDYTGGDIRKFLKIFEDKLHFWKLHNLKVSNHIKEWDSVTSYNHCWDLRK